MSAKTSDALDTPLLERPLFKIVLRSWGSLCEALGSSEVHKIAYLFTALESDCSVMENIFFASLRQQMLQHNIPVLENVIYIPWIRSNVTVPERQGDFVYKLW